MVDTLSGGERQRGWIAIMLALVAGLLPDGPIADLMAPESLLQVHGLPMHVSSSGGHAFALPR